MTTATNPSQPLADLVARSTATITATTGSALPNPGPHGNSRPTNGSPRSWVKALLFRTDHHPQALAAAHATSDLIESSLSAHGTPCWVVLTGQTGCGKSHLARRAHVIYDSAKVNAWRDGSFGHASHVAAPAFALWPWACEFSDQSFADWMDWEVRDARLVILDDVGSESERFRNGANESRLLRVLEACRAKWLLLTTNIPPDQWPKRYDQRISDRLLAANAIANMHAIPSFRLGGAR